MLHKKPNEVLTWKINVFAFLDNVDVNFLDQRVAIRMLMCNVAQTLRILMFIGSRVFYLKKINILKFNDLLLKHFQCNHF